MCRRKKFVTKDTISLSNLIKISSNKRCRVIAKFSEMQRQKGKRFVYRNQSSFVTDIELYVRLRKVAGEFSRFVELAPFVSTIASSIMVTIDIVDRKKKQERNGKNDDVSVAIRCFFRLRR